MRGHTWLAHLRSLKATPVVVGLAALLLAALFVFAMVKEGAYDVRAMVAAIAASILALWIFLPPRMSNYALGLFVFLLAVRCLATGEVLGLSIVDNPLRFWVWTVFLFVWAGLFLHAAYRGRNARAPRREK